MSLIGQLNEGTLLKLCITLRLENIRSTSSIDTTPVPPRAIASIGSMKFFVDYNKQHEHFSLRLVQVEELRL